MVWSTPYLVELTDEERAVVEQRARSSNAPFRAVIRARIVLYAAAGQDNVAIARRVGASRSFVSRIRKRFCQERLKALEERPRSGRPPTFSPQRGRIDQIDRLRVAGPAEAAVLSI